MEKPLRAEFKKTPEDEHDLAVLAAWSPCHDIMHDAKMIFDVMPADYKLVIEFYDRQPKSFTLEKI